MRSRDYASRAVRPKYLRNLPSALCRLALGIKFILPLARARAPRSRLHRLLRRRSDEAVPQGGRAITTQSWPLKPCPTSHGHAVPSMHDAMVELTFGVLFLKRELVS